MGSPVIGLEPGEEEVYVYVIWNNKGGVGKSTITFNLAARYAQQNPDRRVLVLDLCPQANVTMTFMGGGVQGERHLLELQTTSDKIVGYIDERINAISGQQSRPRQYHIQVSRFNEHVPENLWLVPGDGNLELIAPAISYYANAQIPVNAWSIVHAWMGDLVDRITAESGDWTVFIDTTDRCAERLTFLGRRIGMDTTLSAFRDWKEWRRMRALT